MMMIEKTAKGIMLERYMMALTNKTHPTEDILHDIIGLLLWEERIKASYEQGQGGYVERPQFKITEMWEK